MKFKLKGKAKILSVMVLFAAVTGVGLLLDHLHNDKFIVEAVPTDTDGGEVSIAKLTEGETAEKAAADEAVTEKETAEEAVADEIVAEEKTETESAPMVSDGKVNINTATADVLTQLDGIGESMAQRIVEYREKNGEFKDVHELTLVNGIGEKKLEIIIDKICVD